MQDSASFNFRFSQNNLFGQTSLSLPISLTAYAVVKYRIARPIEIQGRKKKRGEMKIQKSHILLFNFFAEAFAALSVFLDLKDPATGMSILDYAHTARERSIVSEFIAPLCFGTCAFASLAAWWFNDTKSRAVWAILTYYHLIIGFQLAPYQFRREPNVLLGNNLIPALAFHIPMGFVSLSTLLSLL